MATMCNAAFCTIALIYTDIQEEWFPKTTIPLPRVMDQWRYELTMAFEIVCILLFGVFDNNQFIYFQF